MAMRNTEERYGVVMRLFHWIMACAILAMFGLGLWMRALDYYSSWYHEAPHLHKSFGLLLLVALTARFAWRLSEQRPRDDHLRPLERRLARLTHRGFYLLLFALMTSGCLIAMAGGRPIDVFDWFSIPSPIEDKGLEKPAGDVHAILAYATVALAALHAAAALKHHFIDRDVTLKRMGFAGRNHEPRRK